MGATATKQEHSHINGLRWRLGLVLAAIWLSVSLGWGCAVGLLWRLRVVAALAGRGPCIPTVSADVVATTATDGTHLAGGSTVAGRRGSSLGWT